MPLLQTLPLELRQKMYNLAITPGTAKLSLQYLKSSSRFVALPEPEDEQAHRALKHNAALVLVSKQVSADARPLLYGCYKFAFKSTRALELFLVQIGDMKQHLRHITIDTGGYAHDFGPVYYGATERSLAMLAAATGLQTLSVSHFDFCCDAFSMHPDIDFCNFMFACAKLLQAILSARISKGVKVDLASTLDIVKVVLPDCIGCFACGKQGHQYVSAKRCVRVDTLNPERDSGRRRCQCKCAEAEHKNGVMVKDFKRHVGGSLGFE